MNSHTTGPQAFADAMQHVAFGSMSAFQNLSIVPLLSNTERDVEYLTLDEALAGGWARITEVSDAGQVSEYYFVRLTNSRGNSRVITFEVIVQIARVRYAVARCWIGRRRRG